MSILYSFRGALIGAAALGVGGIAVGAQQPKAAAFDRTAIPSAGKAPELRVPTWTTMKLANGAQLIVSPR
ncbi:MAG TPA: hypothetical protein VFD67_06600, partial [Gemmatimonadaceae bacterium]|nr:hypothetical protein [Gemmatimonadaceae bacterium]